MNEAAVLVACHRLAASLGLGAVQPQVIGRYSNLVVHLAPGPWVLRVATGTAVPRAQGGHAERELRLLRHLASHGAPALLPAVRWRAAMPHCAGCHTAGTMTRPPGRR